MSNGHGYFVCDTDDIKSKGRFAVPSSPLYLRFVCVNDSDKSLCEGELYQTAGTSPYPQKTERIGCMYRQLILRADLPIVETIGEIQTGDFYQDYGLIFKF